MIFVISGIAPTPFVLLLIFPLFSSLLLLLPECANTNAMLDVSYLLQEIFGAQPFISDSQTVKENGE